MSERSEADNQRIEILHLRNALIRIIERCDGPLGPGRSSAVDSIALLARKALQEDDALANT